MHTTSTRDVRGGQRLGRQTRRGISNGESERRGKRARNSIISLAATLGARSSLPPTSRPSRPSVLPLPLLRPYLRRMQECGLPVDLSTARTSANVTPRRARLAVRPSPSACPPSETFTAGRTAVKMGPFPPPLFSANAKNSTIVASFGYLTKSRAQAGKVPFALW